MPQGDKSSYTDLQNRKAEHIEEGYQQRGVAAGQAAQRAWANVNKGSAGAAALARTDAERSAFAKKAAATRKLTGEI